ncbi:energy transducer TonB [Shimia sp. NS0008-38b]|uniref:TonB family protein n=1 Tax=Shimia sp. NS0008-38b TaxID=3127653 RepID=UPI0031025AEE
MKRILETLVFVGLALSLHVFMATLGKDDGGDADGAGGNAFVSITGAPASIEAVLADWTAAPSHQAQMMADMAPLNAEVNDAPLPSLTLDEAPNASVKIAALTSTNPPTLPDLDLARAPLPPQPKVKTLSEPELSAPREVAPPKVARPDKVSSPHAIPPALNLTQPVLDHSIEPPEPPHDTANESIEKPKADPETKPKINVASNSAPKKKVADKTSIASAGAAPQKAKGAGTSTQAGSLKKSTGLGKGQEASLMSVWAGKIQSRLQRGVRVSKTDAANAQVVLRLKVAPNGRLLNVSIAKSSGSHELDQTVLTSVRRIGRFAKAPKQLTNSSYGFSLPIRVK